MKICPRKSCIVRLSDDSHKIGGEEKSRLWGNILTMYLKSTTKNMGGYQEKLESHHAKLQNLKKWWKSSDWVKICLRKALHHLENDSHKTKKKSRLRWKVLTTYLRSSTKNTGGYWKKFKVTMQNLKKLYLKWTWPDVDFSLAIWRMKK